jgi:putative membrane protein
MKKRFSFRLGVLTCAGALAIVPGTAVAQAGGQDATQGAAAPRTDAGSQQMMSSADKAFAMKAAQDGMAEVQLGKLAADKATNPDVKAFGQQMVDDHTKANDQLKQLAQQENMTVPASIDAKDQSKYEKLTKLSGAEFDKEYVKNMVKDHEMDVKLFQKEADNGKDANIKGFAAQTLPVLQGHLEKIKSIQSKVSSGS